MTGQPLDLLFMREVEQTLLDNKVKIAKEVREDTIEWLYKRATVKETFSGEQQTAEEQALADNYYKLNHSKDSGEKKQAQAAVDEKIRQKTEAATELYKQKIDTLVSYGRVVDFEYIWGLLASTYGFSHDEKPKHHADLIEKLKKEFKQRKDRQEHTPDLVATLDGLYYQARTDYYNYLKEIASKNALDHLIDEHVRKHMKSISIEKGRDFVDKWLKATPLYLSLDGEEYLVSAGLTANSASAALYLRKLGNGARVSVSLEYREGDLPLSEDFKARFNKAHPGWVPPQGNKLYYRLGEESKRLENELANKERDQKLLNFGLRTAKIFAVAQGFFIAGGMFGIMTAWGLGGWLGIIPAAIAGFLFANTTRSNWITINKEMGPLLKEVFFDPNLAHLSWAKRLKILVRRVNPLNGWNTFKGYTNLVAASMLGFLTFTGTLTLLSFVPAVPLIGSLGLGIFGSAPLSVTILGAVLAAVTTLVYFVISNLFQSIKNANPNWQDADLARIEKLRVITHASPYNPLKRYGFNIVIGLTGVSAIMLAAATGLLPFVKAILPVQISFILSLATMVTAVIGLKAIYGISPFYQARTMNSTTRMIVDGTGLEFDEINGDKLDNLDLTGRNAPDFAEPKAKVFAENWGGRLAEKVHQGLNFFFNMDTDNSAFVRKGNAIGQGTPAFIGGAGFSASALTFLMVELGGMGLTAALPIITPVSLVLGGMVMVFASWASYSANSTPLRRVQAKVTEKEILAKDKEAIEKAVDNDQNIKHREYYHLGEEKTKTKLYIDSRESHMVDFRDHYYWAPGSRYTGHHKVEAAQKMILNMDRFVETEAAPKAQREETLSMVSSDEVKSRTTQRLNWLYGEQRQDDFNPLADGELGIIAGSVDHLMGGHYASDYNYTQGDEKIKYANAEARLDKLRSR